MQNLTQNTLSPILRHLEYPMRIAFDFDGGGSVPVEGELVVLWALIRNDGTHGDGGAFPCAEVGHY